MVRVRRITPPLRLRLRLIRSRQRRSGRSESTTPTCECPRETEDDEDGDGEDEIDCRYTVKCLICVDNDIIKKENNKGIILLLVMIAFAC